MAKKISQKTSEARTRTVVKAVTWRILATLTTITIVFLFTKKIFLSLGVGFAEVIAKITFYYLHERAWQKISWGKDRHPLSVLPVKKPINPEDMEKIKDQLKKLGYLD